MTDEKTESQKEVKEGEIVEETKTPKKLFRSQKDYVIAGICGGLGKYFDVDPILFRLGFIIACFAGLAGLIIYLILWILIPLEKSVLKKEEDVIRENTADFKDKAEKMASDISKNPGQLRLYLSLAIIIVGFLFIFQNLGLLRPFHITAWDLIWPSVLIFIGFKLLEGRKNE